MDSRPAEDVRGGVGRWRRRTGGQPKTWVTTIKIDLSCVMNILSLPAKLTLSKGVAKLFMFFLTYLVMPKAAFFTLSVLSSYFR